MTEAKMSLDDWEDGAECSQDALAYCSRCKPHPYPDAVWITRGWSSAFHRSKQCSALLGGQAQVNQRGGKPAAVEVVNVRVAMSTHEPCQICFPPKV